MSDFDPIYADASQPAALHYDGWTVDCPTLEEAVLAFRALPPDKMAAATIKVIGGPTYSAEEIERLHHGQRPSTA
jgi:hypothetical protein